MESQRTSFYRSLYVVDIIIDVLIIFFYNYVYLSPPSVVLAAKDGSRLVAKVRVHMHGHAVEPLYCGYHRVYYSVSRIWEASIF